MGKRIDLIGVPLDENSSYMRGAADAPRVAVDALYCDSANLWTELGNNVAELLHDCGDLDLGSGEQAIKSIEEAAFAVGNNGHTPVFIGGDHSITYPLVKGMNQAVGDFAILHFDAHPDCYQSFEGNRYSHASPFTRIMEDGLCSRLVSVGIRTATGEQREQKARFGMEWHEMKDRAKWPALSFTTPVYISLDMDVLDPAFAPGVSHHEPGGMTTREVIDIIHAIDAPIVGADVVELNPARDINTMTAMTAAKFIREIAGMMVG